MNNERIVCLNGEVNEFSCLEIIVTMLDYDSVNHEPIYLYINSGGGNIIHGLALYDTMKHIKSPVYTNKNIILIV